MQLKTPLIIVNFKTYREASGKNAEKLAKMCEKVSLNMKKSIAVAVQAADLYRVAKAVKIPVLAQHVDEAGEGKYTGYVTPSAVIASGSVGTLLNHSERSIDEASLHRILKACEALRMVTVVCAANGDFARKFAHLNPDFIAVEPPELIGGNISVSTAQPELITDSIAKVAQVKQIPILCGAGVHSKEDVKKAIQLGTKGILLAHGVVLADDPEKALREMASAL